MRNIITIGLLIGCVLFGKAQNEASKWLKAVSAQQGIAIEWQERPTSFAKKGIKSFVGYYKGDFVASLSVGKSVSGSFNYQGTSYEISDSKGQLVFYKNEEGICGNQDKEPHKYSAFARPVLAAEEAQPKIANTQVLRVYRLAMHIPYSTFTTSHLEEKVEKVKTFWADTEAFLNEMYMRDLGVRFEVVNDERLIIKDATKETFRRTHRADYVMSNSTRVIGELIGENSYDVGISLVYTSSLKKGTRGLAYIEGVYQPNTKADAVAVLTKEVIAHEIGHLFGGRHTFGSHKGSSAYDSEKTELDSGTSVMSYGSPRDFFSLSSIERIRQRLTQVPAKAKDKTFATQAPRIDHSKVKNHYTIPKGTFFQFYIPATDPDSEQLLYTVNQHDVRNGDETPITQYTIYKPTTANPVTIKTEYNDSGTAVANSGLVHQTTGTFTFWLGVSDAQPQQAADYIVQYDLAETKVTVKEGTPFEITTNPKNKYKGGEKILLQWKVDTAIFAGTKVRVLLSDDLGKTFKHIVLAETANDGAEEVTLPNINTSKAVLKVEVIEGLAFALTNYNPQTGGFTIEKDNNLVSEPLAFVAATLPQDLNLSCAKEVPTAVMPTTTGGCASVSYRMEEKKTAVLCDNRFTLFRIFTATDGCTTLTHTQTIKVADNILPTFVGTLPQDITIEEGNVTPTQVVLTATDNCGSASVSTTQQTVKQNGKVSKLLYIWKAKDGCGNQVVYTQTIVFTPKAATPPLAFVATTLPQDLTLSCAKEVPTAVMPTTTGGCASVSYRMEEKKTAVLCDNRFTLLRIFTATDGCTTLTHTQTIKVADNIPPTFVGTLPQDITIEEGNVTPTQVVLTATDNCGSASVSTTQQTVKQNGKVSKLLYIWKAKDACGNQAVYTQTIVFTPKAATPPLAFVATTLPQDLNLGCAKEVPTAVMPTTTGGCASVSYRMEEKKTAVLCDNRFTLLRIFTATDGCATLTHTQTIKVADNIPPTFVGTLPQDITIEEGEPIPLQKSISAEDTCAGAPTVKRSEREELNEEGKRVKIIYQWVARDICGNEAVHIQTISITPKKVVPPASNDTAEVVIYNGVSTDDANNYFRIANTDPNSPISVIIFDEMGLKVYESDHYQERGEVFRGYPNVKSVIGSNKALAGTYFYIVKYYKNGKQESAKGFLYVR